MVLFALSCVGLLLFLWLSFGGTIPFNPQGYRVRVSFPNADQLATQADVRIAGVSVGKVIDKSLDPKGNRTIATIQMDNQYAPDPRGRDRDPAREDDPRRDLRRADAGQRRSAKPVPDGGLLPRGQVEARRPARRDLQRVRPDDPPRVPAVAAGARDGGAGQRPEPQQRARQPADVRRRRHGHPARARRRARRGRVARAATAARCSTRSAATRRRCAT